MMMLLGESSSSSSFTSESNLCGKALIKLVCKGHVIIAELQKSSERIPQPFLHAAAVASGLATTNTNDEFHKNGDSSKRFWSFFSSSSSTNSSSSKHSREDGVDDEYLQKKMKDQTTLMTIIGKETKYDHFLFDFSYLRNIEEYETKLLNHHTNDWEDTNATSTTGAGSDAAIMMMEDDQNGMVQEKFLESHRDIITHFYQLFERIDNYQKDLEQISNNLKDGYYIQYTIESVLQHPEGKQLICEALYLYGIMLIITELYIPGAIRERLIIAYLRSLKKGEKPTNFDDICNLFRSTDKPFHLPPDTKQPIPKHQYPLCFHNLFCRRTFPTTFVERVIDCLVTDDLYIRSKYYPGFEHKTVRLSFQAPMIFVVLYFQPKVMENKHGLTREIIDKFFDDNWVIPLYTGIPIDLFSEWQHYGDTKAALDNILKKETVKMLNQRNSDGLKECIETLKTYLAPNTLTDDFVLENISAILNFLRRCNVLLRWRILHRLAIYEKYSTIIVQKENRPTTTTQGKTNSVISPDEIVSMILLLAQLELQLKTIVSRLLKSKHEIWNHCQNEATTIMVEISHYFSGNHALNNGKKNESLMNWFASMNEEIALLDFNTMDHVTMTGRKIQLCFQALGDVMKFDLIDQSTHIKSLLKNAQHALQRMIRSYGIDNDTVETLSHISDLGYAQRALENYTIHLRERVLQDPKSVGYLRGLFLKMSSILTWPTLRLEQNKAEDYDIVSKYYASLLVAFVKGILDIIPLSIFSTLTKIVDMNENGLMSLPGKVQIMTLENYAQNEKRHKLAKITFELSMITEGILGMEKTKLGKIEIRPHEILEEGLRNELVRQVASALHFTLIFPSNDKKMSLKTFYDSCSRSFKILLDRMDGFRRAIEYIQDYVGLPGLKIWVEETTRIFSYYLSQEVQKYPTNPSSFVKATAVEENICLPNFLRTENDPNSKTFIGRTLTALLKLTDPQKTIFSHDNFGWFLPSGERTCDMNLIRLVRQAIGVNGLSGIDCLLSLRILNELQRLFKFYNTTISSHLALLEQIRDTFYPEWKIPTDASQNYIAAMKKTEKLIEPLVICFRRIGQCQLLRQMIQNELRMCAKSEVCHLHDCGWSLKLALWSDFSRSNGDAVHKKDVFPYFVDELSSMMSCLGEYDLKTSLFQSLQTLEGLPILLLLFIISYLPKLVFDKDFGALVRSKEEYPIDGWPLVTAVATLLTQFEQSYVKSFFALVGQYINSSIRTYTAKQTKMENKTQLPDELRNLVIFVHQTSIVGGWLDSFFFEYIPQYLLEMCMISQY